MIDTDGPMDWRELHRREVAAARAVTSHPSFGVTLSILRPLLSEAFAKFDPATRTEGRYSPIDLECEQIKAALVSQPHPLPEKWIPGLTEISMHGVNDPAVEWIWGVAIANAIIEYPQYGADAAWSLLENRHISQEAVIQIFAEGLAGASRNAVLEALTELASFIGAHPDIGVYAPERHGLTKRLEEWRRKELIETVWRDPLDHVPWIYPPMSLLTALLPTEKACFLTLLEKTRLPLAVSQALDSPEIVEKLDLLLELLLLAPDTSEEDSGNGWSWNRNLTAPKLLAATLKHAKEALDPRSDTRTIESLDAQAAPIFAAVAETLLKRNDGIFLSFQWLGHLIGEDHRQSNRSSEIWRPIRAVMSALAEAMASLDIGLDQGLQAFHLILPAPSRLEEMRKSGIGDQERGWVTSATDAFLATTLTEQADARSQTRASAATSLIELYHSVLIRRDQGLYVFQQDPFPTWRHWQPAQLYLSMDAPVAEWESGWRSLAEQRRRAFMTHDDTQADDPSFFHACVGLSLVDYLAFGATARPKEAWECWLSLFDCVFSAALQLNWVRHDRWRHLLAKAFARLPHIRRVDDFEEMAAQLSRLGGDDELLVWCLAMILDNGVEAQLLARAMQIHRVNLTTRLADFIAWEEREGTRRPPSPLAEKAKEIVQVLPPITGVRADS